MSKTQLVREIIVSKCHGVIEVPDADANRLLPWLNKHSERIREVIIHRIVVGHRSNLPNNPL